MKRTDWKYLVDTLLFLCLVGLSLIGLAMAFFMGQGPYVRENEKYFLGLHRHEWGNIHLYLALAFVLFIIIHLILSWSWIKGKTQNLFPTRWKTVLWSTLLASFIIVFVFWLFTPKNPAKYADYGKGAGERARLAMFAEEGVSLPQKAAEPHEDDSSFTVTGQTTLEEIVKKTGISVAALAFELGFPPDTAVQETLGRLKKRYPFTLIDVRDAINELADSDRATLSESEKEQEERIAGESHPIVREAEPEEVHEPTLTRGRLEEDPSAVLITGQMTLSQIEKESGIPASEIIAAMNLPPTIPTDSTLGRLRKQYRFTMQELRDVVSTLMEQKDIR